jgi:phosphonate transport system substrate-binding protein
MMSGMSNFCMRISALALVLLMSHACGKSSSSSKVLRVGFVPAEDAQQVIRNAQPLVEILQKKLGMEVQPFVATDYTGVVEALRVGKLARPFITRRSLPAPTAV